ncbi:MAG: PAS domain S-box protein, partial [Bacteroidota bacterium]
MGKAYFENKYKELEKENLRLKKELQKIKKEQDSNNGSQIMFSDLVDIDLIQSLIDKFYELTNMPVRITDTAQNIIIHSGNKEINNFFHTKYPVLSEPFDNKTPEQHSVYKCKCGCYLIQYDLMISGHCLATVYMGEFLLEDNAPGHGYIQQLSDEYNIDKSLLSKAIQSVPVFSKQHLNLIRQVVITYSEMLIAQGNYSLDLLKSIEDQAIVTRELAEQEKKYKLLTENATDVIWSIGVDFKLAYVSPSIEKFGGYKQEEITGLSLKKILTFDSFKKIKTFLEEHNSSIENKDALDVPYMLELEGIHKDGTIIYFETTINIFRNNKNQIIGIQGISRDITKRKLSEEKEKRYLKSSNFLATTAMDFVNFPIDNDIYHYIGEKLLKLLNKKDVLLIYELDNSDHGELKYCSKHNTIQNITTKFKVNHLLNYNNGKITELKHHKEVKEIIPNEILNDFKEYVNNGKTYINCFPARENVYGLMFVFTEGHTELEKQETINAFITQASIAINKRIAEEQARSYIYHLETLYNTSKQLINPPVKNDIFQYITKIIAPLLPESSFVIAGSYDAHGRFLKIEDAKGVRKEEKNKILSFFGKENIKEISIPLDKENNEFLWNILFSGELCVLDDFPAYLKGLVEKSNKQSMQNMGINDLFIIGFTTQNNLYGALALGFKEYFPLSNKKLIETIIKQFSLVFEKWETQKALKESEEKFRVAFMTSPDAFVISRIKDGVILEVNDGFYNLTGFTPNDLDKTIN